MAEKKKRKATTLLAHPHHGKGCGVT
jgi:hypothetical protein